MNSFFKDTSNICFEPTTIHVVYRVCDCINVCSDNERCFGVDKQKLIFKCLDSIKKSLDSLDGRINIDVHVVEDSCSEDTISYVNKIFSGFKIHLYKLDKKSNSLSFCSCVKIASDFDNDDDIVFFLEDDYLFVQEDIFSKIAVGMEQLKFHNYGKYVGIMPDDYPDRYIDDECTTKVVMTDVGSFINIFSTTCTFITYVGAIKRNLQNLYKFSRWPIVSENDSINLMWRSGGDSWVRLYNPTTAWTLHSQLMPIIPKYIDFVKVNKYFNGI